MTGDRRGQGPRGGFSKASFAGYSVQNGMETPMRQGTPSLWSGRNPIREQVMIKKVAGGYKVLSEKGKNLGGPYKTRKEAEKRLRQVEFFKHKK